jgi:P4 family phage/plasmid primase-like protien
MATSPIVSQKSGFTKSQPHQNIPHNAVIARIEASLSKVILPGATFEIRAVNVENKNRTDSGYFDDISKAAKAAAQLDGKAQAVYVTLHRVNPDLIARANNRIIQYAKTTTSDNDIIHLDYLPLDFDPDRPAGISSSDSEHTAAIEKAQKCAEWLSVTFGWPEGFIGDSGNGGHGLYRIDLPKTDENVLLVQNVIAAIAAQWNDEQVKVDLSVYNPGRIWKLYGTLACKGDDTPKRPHRRASLLHIPSELKIVTLEQLQAVAALAPKIEAPTKRQNSNRNTETSNDVEAVKAGLPDILTLAEKLFPGNVEKSGHELRITGHGGLHIDVEKDCWNIFNGDKINGGKRGGGKLDLIGYAKFKSSWDNHNADQFKEMLSMAAEIAGVTLTEREASRQQSKREKSTAAENSPKVDKAKFNAPDVARAFVAQFTDLAYDADGQTWREWSGSHWGVLTDTELLDLQMAEIIEGLGMDIPNNGRVDVALRYARARSKRKFVVSNERLLNFKNGTFDLATNKLREHRKDDNLTYSLPYDYRRGNYPIIARFLDGVIPDEVMQEAYMTHIGLALIGDRTFHKAFLLYGPRRSGKSTALELATMACGQERGNYAGEIIFSPESEGMRMRAVRREQKLTALDEFPEDAIRGNGESIFKIMTAHGGVPMRNMYQKEITDNRWKSKILMATNDAPRITDRSGALFERLIIVRCPNTRKDAEQDRKLFDKMLPELPEFVGDCVELAQIAIDSGQYPVNEAMRKLVSDIETTGDGVKSWLADNCVFEKGAFTSSATLWTNYSAYCEENGQKPMSKPRLVQALNDRYSDRLIHQIKRVSDPITGKDKPTRGLMGIRLRTDNDPLPDDVTHVTTRYASNQISESTVTSQNDAKNSLSVTHVTVKSEKVPSESSNMTEGADHTYGENSSDSSVTCVTEKSCTTAQRVVTHLGPCVTKNESCVTERLMPWTELSQIVEKVFNSPGMMLSLRSEIDGLRSPMPLSSDDVRKLYNAVPQSSRLGFVSLLGSVPRLANLMKEIGVTNG